MDGKAANSARKEIPWSSFREVVQIAKSRWGIHLEDSKRALISTRLQRRMRDLGISDFEKYIEVVKVGNSAESSKFISAITTNVTGFNRESHHFSYLKLHMEDHIRSECRSPYKVWSAGCSSGQEVYSVCGAAISCDRKFCDPSNFQVLGTDVDKSVLLSAEHGEYAVDLLKPLDVNTINRVFDSSTKGFCAVKEEIRSLVRFEEYNLMDRIPSGWRFNAIFCRNVTIYFDQITQQKLWRKLCSALLPGGILIIGHSERIDDHFGYGLSPAGITTFKKYR